MLKVFSIFKSIQGESTRAGLPCTFIRLAGCPLHCTYCDTREACESEGVATSVEGLIIKVGELGKNLVEVTGGEPLAQKETHSLMSRLCDENYEVMLETSGVYPIDDVDPRVRVVMDVKCPGSGMSDRILMKNFVCLDPNRHELKFVVGSKEDFDWGMSFIRKNKLESQTLLFSPVSGEVSLEELSRWILEAPVAVRLQPQLHKLVWPNTEEEV